MTIVAYGRNMTDKLKLFQEDLRNGMSIHDALQKHGLTFKETVDSLKSKPRLKPFYTYCEKYIYRIGKWFYIRKNIKGRQKEFA